MKKTIRPLAAFKTVNPEIYKELSTLSQASSLKAKENDFYFFYAVYSLEVEKVKETLDPTQIRLIKHIKNKLNLTEEELEDEINSLKKATRHLIKREFNSFFYTEQGEPTNKGTVSELGRLLLYGWHYEVKEWTQEIGMYIYKAYKKKESKGEPFNDLDFKEAIKHIRENIGYYYNNAPELKLYILESFFKDQLEQLLPEKPLELQQFDDFVNFLTEMRGNQKKKGIDYWINEAESWQDYAYYLQELIEDNFGAEAPTFEQWKKEQNSEEYTEEIQRLREEYKASYINKINLIDLKKQ